MAQFARRQRAGWPVQPPARKARAVCSAVTPGCSMSAHPYRSTRRPLATASLSRRWSWRRRSSGWAARPSSSRMVVYSSYLPDR